MKIAVAVTVRIVVLTLAATCSLSSCGGGISDLPVVAPPVPVYDMTKFLPFGKHLVEQIIPENQVEYFSATGVQKMQIFWGASGAARRDMENYSYDDYWIYLDYFEWSDNGYQFPIVMKKMELLVNGVPKLDYPPPKSTPWAPRWIKQDEYYTLRQWGEIRNIAGIAETRYAAISVFGFGGPILNPCFIPTTQQTKQTLTQVEAWLDEPVGAPGTGIWKWLTSPATAAFNSKGEPLPILGTPTRANWIAEGIGHLWKFQDGEATSCIKSIS